VRLVWANALLYNPEGSDIHQIALSLSNMFENAYQPIARYYASGTPSATSVHTSKRTAAPPKKRRRNSATPASTSTSASTTPLPGLDSSTALPTAAPPSSEVTTLAPLPQPESLPESLLSIGSGASDPLGAVPQTIHRATPPAEGEGTATAAQKAPAGAHSQT
jgi:hypothetical protein